MARFWTHAGANYIVNLDEVTFGGNQLRNGGYSREARDAAMRLFADFVGAACMTIHQPRLVQREVNGASHFLVAGCLCGWSVPKDSAADPEDLLAHHVAAAQANAKSSK